MDKESLSLMRRVWKHAQLAGNVWVPHISHIGVKGKERFSENSALSVTSPKLPTFTDNDDWYWTPAVSTGGTRRVGSYPAQRVLWADLDGTYNNELLLALKPSFLWETSPGNKQAIWLMQDAIAPAEFDRNGLMGTLTHALGADKSGVDIGQLLRVPGTMHHKREPFKGRILRKGGGLHTRGMLLTRVAKGLGLHPGVASDLGAEDPWGDRSGLLWKFARSAAEAGLDQDLAYKLIKACAWNKWKDEPEKLQTDIAKAYSQGSAAPEKPAIAEATHDPADEEEAIGPWELGTVAQFGPVLNEPIKWIVPNIIQESAVGLLVAAPKVGKTRIAIELALGLATGDRPLGLKVRKPLNVGFLSLEDGQYLFAERLNHTLNKGDARFPYHWQGHMTPDLRWMPPKPMGLYSMFDSADLRTGEDQQRLYETILQYKLNLVIIDTLSMAIGDANVSDQKEMYALLKPIKVMAKATGCAIMLIHHTRKRVFEKGESVQERILGATALHGWSDFIMSLSEDPEDGSDLLRLGVQTKRGQATHYISLGLRIVPRPPSADGAA